MKVAIVGGHLTPALAVIEKLLGRDEVFYIGRRHALIGESAVALEYEVIRDLGVPFEAIAVGKFQRTARSSIGREFSKIPLGLIQSMRILKRQKPDVILCFGSYVAIPVCLAAKILRIPVVIHEQTQDAGLANRVVAPFTYKICISFESSRKYFPKNKTILTGNPIRDSIKNPKKIKLTNFDEDLPLVFVTGGSQGSHTINELIEYSLIGLTKFANVLHQTGESRYNDYARLADAGKKLNTRDRYKVVKFLNPNDFGAILKESSLVVGRAGANTVNELLFLGKPSLLIPLSFAQKQEQTKNAMLAKDLGIGEILSERNDSGEFIKKVTYMLENLDNYKPNKKIDWKNSTEALINILRNATNKN